jgi:hypothetical protein
MKYLHENAWGYHNPTGTELDKFNGDLIASSKDMEVLRTVELIFHLAEHLVVHDHLIIQT